MSEYDVIVWGATGFTGKLVARYLHETYGADLKWAMGGRSQAKLEMVRGSIGADVPLVVADSDDEVSLGAMVEQAKVIATTVGPYARYGSKLVEACAATGTHYCDLTGEVQWMRRMIDAHNTAAEESGARIVHTCGFDSIPFDLGVHVIQREMMAQHGVFANRVKTRVVDSRGGASGGTIESMMNMMDEAKDDPSIFELLSDPYSLNPNNMPRGPDGADQFGVEYDMDFRAWTAPFVMAAINTRVVRRSHALKGYPYGDQFSYGEAMVTGNGPGGWAAASAIAGVSAMVGGAAAMAPLRNLMRRMAPAPGEGPSEQTMATGYYQIQMHAEHPDDKEKSVRLEIRGDRDPGYGSTSKMLAESALCLAQDELESPGGVTTPAASMGDALVERLNAKAGVTFQVI